MKIIFQAIDGKLFYDRADAEQYEQHILDLVQMWNLSGEPTTDTMNAYVIHLAPEGGKMFIALSQVQGTGDYIDGIDDESMGWYVWDDFSDSYSRLNDDIVNSLRKILVS